MFRIVTARTDPGRVTESSTQHAFTHGLCSKSVVSCQPHTNRWEWRRSRILQQSHARSPLENTEPASRTRPRKEIAGLPTESRPPYTADVAPAVLKRRYSKLGKNGRFAQGDHRDVDFVKNTTVKSWATKGRTTAPPPMANGDHDFSHWWDAFRYGTCRCRLWRSVRPSGGVRRPRTPRTSRSQDSVSHRSPTVAPGVAPPRCIR